MNELLISVQRLLRLDNHHLKLDPCQKDDSHHYSNMLRLHLNRISYKRSTSHHFCRILSNNYRQSESTMLKTAQSITTMVPLWALQRRGLPVLEIKRGQRCPWTVNFYDYGRLSDFLNA